MSESIFIAGVGTGPKDVSGWKKDLGPYGIILGTSKYLPFDFFAINQILAQCLEAITEETTTIYAHSFGGLFARAAIARKPSNISQLHLMGCPHLGGLNTLIYGSVLGSLQVPDSVKILSYGASGDLIVEPKFVARHPRSSDHIIVAGGHMAFLEDASLRASILAQNRDWKH